VSESVEAAPSGRKSEGVLIDNYSRLLNKRELGEFLGKSLRSVDRLIYSRRIPFLKVGGAVRFRLEDVERALDRFMVKEVSR
jgi:excisionase family DNA binding protein